MASVHEIMDRSIPCLIPLILWMNIVKYGNNLNDLYHLVAIGVSISTLVIMLQHPSLCHRFSENVFVLYTFVLLSLCVFLGCLMLAHLCKEKSFNLTYTAPIFFAQSLLGMVSREALRKGFTRKTTEGEGLLIAQCISMSFLVFTSTRMFPSLDMTIDNRILVELSGTCLLSILSLYISRKIFPRTGMSFITDYAIIFAHLSYSYKSISDVIQKKSPIIWMANLIFETQNRLHLFRSWLLILTATIMIATVWSRYQSNSMSSGMRKCFHLSIVVIFLSGFERDLKFMSFAGGCVLAAFVMLEIFRIIRLPPVGSLIEQAFSSLRGGTDDSTLTLGHIYLLAGFFMPMWLIPDVIDYDRQGTKFFVVLSGLISVGFGDSAAAIFGSLFGYRRWPNSHKTVQGTIAAFTAQMIFGFLWLNLDRYTQIEYIVVCAITSLAEAFLGSYDNISLPLITTLVWLI